MFQKNIKILWRYWSMNKKIKSLLVAGLLVLGMSGMKNDVFAAELLTSTIKDIVFVTDETQKVIPLQNGYITVTINKNNGVYDVVVEWDKTAVDVVGMTSIFENNSLYSDFNTCYDYVTDGNKIIVTIRDVGSVPTGFDPMGELVQIDVNFNLVDTDGDGAPDIKDDTPNGEEPEDPQPPAEPQEPTVIDPETGDVSTIAFVATIALSTAGLVYVNRKKDDEE
jgi:hypothetical protein